MGSKVRKLYTFANLCCFFKDKVILVRFRVIFEDLVRVRVAFEFMLELKVLVNIEITCRVGAELELCLELRKCLFLNEFLLQLAWGYLVKDGSAKVWRTVEGLIDPLHWSLKSENDEDLEI